MLIRFALLTALCCAAPAFTEDAPASVRVMSFNLWGGGESGMLPLKRTADVIRAAKADVVGVQEAYGREVEGVRPDRSKELADMLGWQHADQGDGKTILSRFPIESLTPGKHGARIALPGGESLYLFNVHLFHAPYQPYQLLKIDYEDAPFLETEAELIAAAEAARGPELAETLAELKPLLESGAYIALTGDFNEPSHLDWTARAKEAGVVPMAVAYPASKQAAALGLVDAFRSAHPDESARPGFAWTPTTRPDDPTDRHDRIDFVYASPNLSVLRAEIVGENNTAADIGVRPYPSDHRAVAADLAPAPRPR
jgi:endonuclease/exonuclease/phosphatase family metal-dependent hydrolase